MLLLHQTKKTEQSLSDFHTGIGADAHATLDRVQKFISHTRTVLVDTFASIGS